MRDGPLSRPSGRLTLAAGTLLGWALLGCLSDVHLGVMVLLGPLLLLKYAPVVGGAILAVSAAALWGGLRVRSAEGGCVLVACAAALYATCGTVFHWASLSI